MDQVAELAARASSELQDAIVQNELELPILPEAASHLRSVIEMPQVTAQDIVEAVAQAPALSAQLIKLANSPMFCAEQQLQDLTSAVSWLGAENAGSLVNELAMSNLFQAVSQTINVNLYKVNEHALKVAAVAAQIAEDMTDLAPEAARMAGLTHNLGALPVLVWAEGHRGLISDESTLQALIDALQPGLGAKMLTAWSFPTSIACVPAACELWGRQVDATDFVDVVQLAVLFVLRGTNHRLATMPWERVPAYARLGVRSDKAFAMFEQRCADVQLQRTMGSAA